MSDVHIWYLRTCWKSLLESSALLRSADVRVYMNSPKVEERADALHLLNNTFMNQNITVHVRSSWGTGKTQYYGQHARDVKQREAMESLTYATILKWFTGYDWVIRINPDVMIRDDTFLVNTIANDTNASAILINCDWSKNQTRAHTDFFAIKPKALDPLAFLAPSTSNAEASFTNDIRPILESKGHRWIRDAFPTYRFCQAGWGNDKSPIIHKHFDISTSVCPLSFGKES